MNTDGVHPPMGVNVMVDVGQGAHELPDTALLFVFVRKPGERKPEVVEYFAANDVPPVVPFLLEEDSGEVEVVARLSVSGRVERHRTDPEQVARVTVAHPPATISMVLPPLSQEVVAQDPQVAALN